MCARTYDVRLWLDVCALKHWNVIRCHRYFLLSRLYFSTSSSRTLLSSMRTMHINSSNVVPIHSLWPQSCCTCQRDTTKNWDLIDHLHRLLRFSLGFCLWFIVYTLADGSFVVVDNGSKFCEEQAHTYMHSPVPKLSYLILVCSCLAVTITHGHTN